jgi:hypothetical protein
MFWNILSLYVDLEKFCFFLICESFYASLAVMGQSSFGQSFGEKTSHQKAEMLKRFAAMLLSAEA